MLNLTRLHLGIAHESQFQGLGIRELIVLFVVSSTLTLAVFFLALLLLPFETFNPFSFPRFPGFF